MFGIFKKKTRKAITEVKKMENRDAVEATVWGAYSIAFADGTCDAKEIAVLEKTIAALPAFTECGVMHGYRADALFLSSP